MKSARWIIAYTVLMLAGCATDRVGQHSYHDGICVDCYNNPITGEPINYRKGEERLAGNPSNGQPPRPSPAALPPGAVPCGAPVHYSVDGTVDVDTAYARLKREFGYMTRDETLQARGINPGSDLARKNQWFASGYKHDAEVGARYAMSDSIVPRFAGNRQKNWLTLEIDKNGAGSRVHVSYCNGGAEGFSGGETFGAQLRGEIQTVIAR